MDNYLLGIDLGSTSLKAVAFNLNGKVRASSSRPTEEFHPDAQHPEQSIWHPESIWGGTAAAIHDVVDEIGDAGQIAAVAVTGMGMDGLPVDQQGQWLYPFISWHDNRTFPQHQWWLENVGAERIFKTCGHAALLINSINRLMWMKEHEPEILKSTDKWLLIEDYVNLMLCGVKATDYSMAATTQVLDCENLTWSNELIELSGVEARLFPQIFPSGTVLGEVHAQAGKVTGLKVGTPVVLGGHDYLMGAMAAGGMEPGTLVDITGTWEMITSKTERPVLTYQAFEAGVVWDPHVIKGTYCLFIDAVAASMLEWYRSQFGELEKQQAARVGSTEWEVLMQEAASVGVGAGGVTFLPHLSGCTAPVKDPQSQGAFVGIAHTSTRPMFIRAVIEGLSYQARQMIESVEAIGGPHQAIRVIGGATRNTFWMQVKADVLDRQIEIPDMEEATCLGAAMTAGIGVGLFTDEADAFRRVYHPGCVYKPLPAAAEKYEQLYQEIYKPIYDALRPVHHRVYQLFR
jgi:xylulokinase